MGFVLWSEEITEIMVLDKTNLAVRGVDERIFKSISGIYDDINFGPSSSWPKRYLISIIIFLRITMEFPFSPALLAALETAKHVY